MSSATCLAGWEDAGDGSPTALQLMYQSDLEDLTAAQKTPGSSLAHVGTGACGLLRTANPY